MIQKTKTPLRGNVQRPPQVRVQNPRTIEPKMPMGMGRVSIGQGETPLRIAIIGGAEEVGRNMTMIEYGNDIILIDMGMQFPEEGMHGIDYIIPNTEYLEKKKSNIRGVIITHAHMDHIGAIPHLVQRLGNPPIFGSQFTIGLIKKRQNDFQDMPVVNTHEVGLADILSLGCFTVEFFHITHTVPQSRGVLVHTPLGNVVHTGDWKFDFTPVGEPSSDFIRYAQIGAQGVLALLSDSTNATKPGHQISESEVAKTIGELVEKATGRIIIATFSTLLSRVKMLIEHAERLGKKIAIDGYSMRTNVEVAKELGFIKAKSTSFINIQEVNDYPDEKVLIIGTGAQGQSRAMLMRIATGEHRHVQLKSGDTIIFSSSLIPGNERTVQNLIDHLMRKGARVINYEMMDVHAGGHAKQEDIKLMVSLMRPKYFVPIEGNHHFLRANAQAAMDIGFDQKNIFIPDNGQVMEFMKSGGRLTSQRIPSDYVFVDGLGVGDVSHVVLRDRQMMAEDGMIVVIATIQKKTGKLIGNPDIISRGFIYMKEQKKLVEQIRLKAKEVFQTRGDNGEAYEDYIRAKVRDDLGTFIFKKTERRPMILPVVIEV